MRAGADQIDGPAQPPPMPKNDPELRALIDKQDHDDITGSESYLNCLNDEVVRARAAYDEIRAVHPVFRKRGRGHVRRDRLNDHRTTGRSESRVV